MRRRRDPKPVAGGQQAPPRAPEAADEELLAPTPHDEIAPAAGAPKQILETHVPGTAAAQKEKLTGNPFVRIFKLFREGLDIRNLRSSYGRTPLVLLMLLSVIGVFGANAFTLSIPEIQEDLELSIGVIITVIIWVGLLGTLLSVPFGYIGDRRNRVRMVSLGGIVSSLGVLSTGLSGGKFQLGIARSAEQIGDLGPNAVRFGLIADYVPQEDRGRSFAFRNAGVALGAILAPIFVGTVGARIGWRAPFLIVGVLGLLLSLTFMRMPEPIRGYHERKAWGADEETSRRVQEAPSWGEAFRAAWGVRTLRRISYSIPFTALSSLGFTVFFPLYLARTHGIDIQGRGFILAGAAAASLLGLAIGGPLVDRVIGRNPGRVVIINGAASLLGAAFYGIMALAPSAWMVVTAIVLFRFVDAIVLPAYFSVASLVIPPRLRNLGLATLDYWTLPVFFAFPIIAGVAENVGYRASILLFVPFSAMAAIIFMTAGPYVEFDIRSATSAAMAAEEWRRAREEGRAKLLVLRNVDVHYETVQVLFDVDLDVQDGELIALLGTNGAGKSTLLKAISGVQEATGGAIVFDGRDITHVPPHEIAGYGVAQTPGGRGVFPGLSVRENLQLAGWLYGQDAKHKAELELVFTYFPILRQRLDQQAGSLSGGEQQMLTLAQAFLARPRLLMIDELSLGLSPAVVAQLLVIVRAIHERGTTIIIVEQSVNIALTLAKRAIFMEKGEIRFDGPTADLLARPDIMRAVFLKGASALTLEVGPTAPERRQLGDRPNVVEVFDLQKSYGGVKAVDGVTFALREHEVLGLIGPNGAGKTTVLEIISGFNPPDRGRIVYEGRDITDLTPDQRAKLGLVRRFQDAKLFPSLSVAETIAISFERSIGVRSMLMQGLGLPQARQSEQRVRRAVDRLVDLLNLGAYAEKLIAEVSTGTRRIVDIACVLAAEPRVLLLDEPSSGLAQREAESLAPLLQRVRRELGCSMLVIEHDMPLISAVSDELIAMDLGRIVTRGTPEDVLEDERVVRAYLGTSEEVIARSGRIAGS